MRRAILILLSFLCACDGEAEKAVRRGMLDPDATQFRDVRQCSGDRAVWRGEANGKNSYGAYTGFKPFFYSEGAVAYAGDPAFMLMMGRCYSDLKDTAPQVVATASESPTVPDNKPPRKILTDKDPGYTDVEVEGPGRPNLAKQDRCWVNYCPCDTTDPDFGGADKFLCDRVRNGLPVDDEQMSIASGARDARRQLRESGY